MRLKYVKDNKLCESCLLNNHVTANCKKPSVCTVVGCGKKHTRLIHVVEAENKGNVRNDPVTNRTNDVVSANVSTDIGVNLPVVYVTVNNEIGVHALLDTGSTNSFCSEALMKRLGIVGKDSKVTLNTINGCKEQNSKLVDFMVTSSDGSNCLDLRNVLVVDNIPVKTSSVCFDTYPHLSGLPIIHGDSVDILLGQDNAEALVPLEVKQGKKGEPFAVRTILGWSVNGPNQNMKSGMSKAVANFVNIDSLNDKVNSMWDIENENFSSKQCSWSVNDKSVIELWDKECKVVNGHYELPIPWKSDVHVPNNYVMAISRLRSLYTNLVKRDIVKKYNDEIRKLIDSGYAEPVPVSEVISDNNVWYVPHQAVMSDKKPGKTRIVFDCAAKFRGESLNDKCLQGPDLNNKLLHVLLRFRQYKYAILSDIEAMYYQVVIPPKDRDVLRFLWFDEDGSIVHYRMTRHLFGGIWCSSSATYALRKICIDVENPDPVVVDTVMNSFYVDDCLRSVATKAEAIKVIHGTKSLLKSRGFNLTKFVVNDDEVLSSVPIMDWASEIESLGLDHDTCSKVLGVKWSVVQDQFYFDIKTELVKPITRRSILSIVSTTFDPLGLLAPVILMGRMLFQEATRLKLGWDEQVPEQVQVRWSSWLHDLSHLAEVRIPRCVTFDNMEGVILELHHFSDASMKAYGCCSYLRSIDNVGNIRTVLLMSKAKVAPLKSVTLPRLELQAAVMSAQVDAMLKSELNLMVTRSYFWVDSEIVIKYVQNESRRFHVFVANRVGIIHELTNPDQWYHISGKENPADVVSRGLNPKELDVSKWIFGPDFLRSHDRQWHSHCLDPVLSLSDPEVRSEPKVCLQTISEAVVHPIDTLVSYYSSWTALKRAVAWWIKVIQRLKDHKLKRATESLSVHDIRHAETCIIRHVQHKVFSSEISRLSSGNPINKTSSLRKLDPMLDSNGVLVVGGRIRRSLLDEGFKHPCIVPYDSPVAYRIVLECHEIAHYGCEWVVAQVRQKYWVTRIRNIVRKVKNNCVKCRQLFAEPCCQKMADLPIQRLEAHKPPFSYTGIDCFGPFIVKQGRSVVKRYGCIFT